MKNGHSNHWILPLGLITLPLPVERHLKVALFEFSMFKPWIFINFSCINPFGLFFSQYYLFACELKSQQGTKGFSFSSSLNSTTGILLVSLFFVVVRWHLPSN